MPIIECIPNISEGRRPDVVATIAAAVGRTPGVRVLDVSSDAAHHRSVLTMAGDAAGPRTAHADNLQPVSAQQERHLRRKT